MKASQKANIISVCCVRRSRRRKVCAVL